MTFASPSPATTLASTRPTIVASVRTALAKPLAPYYLVLGSTVMLTALGLVMVLSASSVESYASSGSSWVIGQRQAIFVAIGVPVLLVASRISSKWYRRLSLPLLVVSLVLLVLVLVPGIGVSVNGNQNWIDIGGPFRIQPAELAKLALVVWGADMLTRKRKLLHQQKHVLIPLVPVAALVVGLVLLGGDLGTSLILMSIVAGLLFIAGAPLRVFLGLAAPVLGLIVFMTFQRSARLSRLESFLDPFADYEGAGWQAAHSMFALASGGWWGVGLGASSEKWGTLPEAHTDFIFAIIGEELGLVGTVTVLLLFGALILGALRIAMTTTDTFVRFAAGGMVVWIGAQMIINIGGVLSVIPITGVPLPLVSYGGSALLATMLGLGMLLSFARDLPGARQALAGRRGKWRRPWGLRGAPRSRGRASGTSGA